MLLASFFEVLVLWCCCRIDGLFKTIEDSNAFQINIKAGKTYLPLSRTQARSKLRRIAYVPERPHVEVLSRAATEVSISQVVSSLVATIGPPALSRDKRAVSGGHHGGHSKGGQGGKSMTRHCGGTFTDMGGLILSPNYPLYYPNMHDCLYMIKLPDKDASGTNLTIKITCDDFRTQGLKVNIAIS